ncbi:hypothetical protein SeMB42_g02057 [Synchytrium endobioticum]|uniref:Major facilitator superfamily (MFS) profile domain-containing protein n=1 Tax=Synchytrium endobioticum TaxID=286115 RepID=A0A507DGZ1_9FUNG|nr:hypothetical protein SeLEV6574_g01995 [Synchytrium endobioticum]TPX50959.1 hypothetical protein SeMB42_g02057 [Synchytrium endobioticum]
MEWTSKLRSRQDHNVADNRVSDTDLHILPPAPTEPLAKPSRSSPFAQLKGPWPFRRGENVSHGASSSDTLVNDTNHELEQDLGTIVANNAPTPPDASNNSDHGHSDTSNAMVSLSTMFPWYRWLILFFAFVSCAIVLAPLYGMPFAYPMIFFFPAFDLGVFQYFIPCSGLWMMFLTSAASARSFTFLGPRNTVILGTIIYCVGLLLFGYLAKATEWTVFIYAIMCGVGASLVLMPFIGLVSQYFRSHATLAIGLLFSGGWLGSLAWFYILAAFGTTPSCLWGLVSFIILMTAAASLESKSLSAISQNHTRDYRPSSFTICLLAFMILSVGIQPVLVTSEIIYAVELPGGHLLIPFAVVGSVVLTFIADFLVGRYLMLLISSVSLGTFMMLGPNVLGRTGFDVLVGLFGGAILPLYLSNATDLLSPKANPVAACSSLLFMQTFGIVLGIPLYLKLSSYKSPGTRTPGGLLLSAACIYVACILYALARWMRLLQLRKLREQPGGLSPDSVVDFMS